MGDRRVPLGVARGARIAGKEVVAMKIATGWIIAVALAAIVASAALGATPKKSIAFNASYSGTAAVNVTDNVADIQANGSGSGTLLGAGNVTGIGKGDASQQPCVPFNGPGTLNGAGGKLGFTVLSGSSGCGDDAGQVFSISGKAKVTSATGKLKKATGTLRFTGVYDRGAGTFSVKFKGTLSQ
jgi:hypothetical protein